MQPLFLTSKCASSSPKMVFVVSRRSMAARVIPLHLAMVRELREALTTELLIAWCMEDKAKLA